MSNYATPVHALSVLDSSGFLPMALHLLMHPCDAGILGYSRPHGWSPKKGYLGSCRALRGYSSARLEPTKVCACVCVCVCVCFSSLVLGCNRTNMQLFIVMAFSQEKQRLLDEFPLCPNAPAPRRQIYFYCRLAVSETSSGLFRWRLSEVH